MSAARDAAERLKEALAHAMLEALKQEGFYLTTDEYTRSLEKLMDSITIRVEIR